MEKNNLITLMSKTAAVVNKTDYSVIVQPFDDGQLRFALKSNVKTESFSSIPETSSVVESSDVSHLGEEFETQQGLMKAVCENYRNVTVESSNNLGNFGNYSEADWIAVESHLYQDDKADVCETVVVETLPENSGHGTIGQDSGCQFGQDNLVVQRMADGDIGPQIAEVVECFDITTEEYSDIIEENLPSNEESKSECVKRYQCDYCSQFFSRAGDLKRHLSTHTKSRSGNRKVDIILDDSSGVFQVNGSTAGDRKCVFECSQCSKYFTQRSTLVRHQRTHNGERPYTCAYCFKSFVQLVHLRRHTESTHSEDGWQHQCKTCSRKFSRVESLSVHERIHSGELPYSCGTCGKSFRHLSSCRLHELTHTGARPYVCTQCERTFGSTGALRSHERGHSSCEKQDIEEREMRDI